ncbi:MAG TPA: RNA polymerase sigma factor [Bacteroidales bacterium]|nr:RNA polymerase sigma factor [Bacteroidales bacterium]
MEEKDNITARLVEECRQGRSQAQEMLYKQYSRAMFNLAYRITNNREDAEDILQDTFIECFRKISSFRNESTFGAWLKSILVNRSINHLRRKKVSLVYLENLPDTTEDEASEPLYDTDHIFRGIGMLPDGYRIILTLYLLEGYDHSEISTILGITESTSKSQYSRAKDKLRKLINNQQSWTN